MKYILFFLLVWIWGGTSLLSAQLQEDAIEAPDMEEMQAQINDPSSPLYYPVLMQRYLDNDTTLNLAEYRCLYIGYSFQEDYNPYRVVEHTDRLKELYANSDYNEFVCDSIIKYARLAIDDFPFDLRQMNMLVYAYRCKGDKVQEALWSYKLKSIVDAILSKGDGQTQESAWFVIYPAHEYDIINRLGLTVTSYVFEKPYFDHLKVDTNPFKVEGYFFNVSRVLTVFEQKYK